MQDYLKEFYRKVKRYEGGLVRVNSIKKFNKNAKEYLPKLAKQGVVEKAAWGWYYIKPRIKRDKEASVLEFLQHDNNFKVVINQSAASFWNQDFIHRVVLNIVVDNRPFKKALETFAKKRGWSLTVEYNKNARRLKFENIKKLAIEAPDEAILGCVKNWAFADAISVLVVNKNRIDMQELIRKSYWSRISGTNVRIRQAIEYAAYKLSESGLKFMAKKITIKNSFVRQELDEAIEKVLEFE